MSFPGISTISVLLGGILLLYPRGRDYPISVNNMHTVHAFSSAFIYPGKIIKTEGYRAIIGYEDGFLAAGSGGRIDWISVSGRIIKSEKFPEENFNCLLSDNQMVIVAGDRGTILISSDRGMFRKADSGTDKNINSLTLFNRAIIAGTDGGEIISGDASGSFKIYHLDLKGNIVSVTARTSDCYGVTDKGEIIHSTNGINWDIFDFNKVYKGFYKPCFFTRILLTENRIAIAGIQNDGSPVFMLSNQGKVWTERALNYTDDQGIIWYLTDLPNDILYDDLQDQFFLVCANGKLMNLPSCSQCNKLAVISLEDLTGISCNENTMMIVGNGFFIKAVNLR